MKKMMMLVFVCMLAVGVLKVELPPGYCSIRVIANAQVRDVNGGGLIPAQAGTNVWYLDHNWNNQYTLIEWEGKTGWIRTIKLSPLMYCIDG